MFADTGMAGLPWLCGRGAGEQMEPGTSLLPGAQLPVCKASSVSHVSGGLGWGCPGESSVVECEEPPWPPLPFHLGALFKLGPLPEEHYECACA